MTVAIAVALCVATLGTSLPAQAPASDPLVTYKQYLAVLAKAKSLDELLPYYAKELSEGLKKMPADMRANYLKMNARTLTDLKVTKQTVTADKAEFEMTAKTATGAVTTGSATLVKEGGAWKIDDEAWATPQ
jgi:hypothetical protein